jgi:hypothetical protein
MARQVYVPGVFRRCRVGRQGTRWWGDLQEPCPDPLIDQLNGTTDYERVAVLHGFHRAQKR